MNKLITTIEFKTPRESKVEFCDEYVIIAGVKFEGFHDQDCCEYVYADFNIIKYYKSQIEKLGTISKIELKSVPECGFILFIYSNGGYFEKREGVLINCYNCQNGYYSSALDLIITDGSHTVGTYDLDSYYINK